MARWCWLAATLAQARGSGGVLTELGIVIEMTGQRKNRTFGYQRYIELLARSE
jgi:hypothetical protein